ncbi:hypothetical protein EDF81_2837 [Enterobacter sp. BIGb0383]|uniref:hypothetical protein n=1 Tax=unclassified Enterobacter TaxID=2608935 RepID=UPI000F493A70|nr:MULTISPECIES: hypothetical protein [unclassified Enterobacter]ROP60012.1 hypothetical protein EDF81_2837 [Enterobacter sp. BIGb0383]ROS08520.1 hypothetical protein EC848_1998 [Enterobacter sp. BIGb0359]
MPRIASRALLLIAAMLLPAYGFTEDALPKGKDYPAAPLYTGKTAASVDYSDDFTNTYRTRFKEALANPVAFAGEYSTTSWGCGLACTETAFINKRTGRALNLSFKSYSIREGVKVPFGAEIVYMKQDSNLLVTYGSGEEGDKPAYDYYALKEGKLSLIKHVDIQGE